MEQKITLGDEELGNCEKHPSYLKNLLCLATGKTICSECAREPDHEKHNHVFLKDTFDDLTTRINNTNKEADEMLQEQKSCTEKTKSNQSKFTEEIKSLKKKVSRYYEILLEKNKKEEECTLGILEKALTTSNEKINTQTNRIKNLEENSTNLKNAISALKDNWIKKSDGTIKKSALIEEYLAHEKELASLKQQTTKLIHETGWKSRIEITPNLADDEKSWDFSEFDALKVRVHELTITDEDFVDQEGMDSAEKDEKRQALMAGRVDSFDSYCIHEKEKYPTSCYCDKCNEFFCSSCAPDHKCSEKYSRGDLIKADKKKRHEELIVSATGMKGALETLNKANIAKRNSAIANYVTKLNEITEFYKKQRMELHEKEAEKIESIKKAFFDEQKEFDKLSMNVKMCKDSADYYLSKGLSIKFDWDCEDNNKDAIYKPIRQLIKESRDMCDQEEGLEDKVNKLKGQCEYNLAFDFTYKAELFKSAQEAVAVSVTKQKQQPAPAPDQQPAPAPAPQAPAQ